MQEFTFEAAQSDMRRSYFFGAPGVLASGLVWLIASTVAALNSEKAAVLVLLLGGAAIHPLGVAIARLLGRPGTHTPGNPLGRLAIESTFWLIAGCAIAYGMHVLRIEWFFPAMLLVIGGRYLTFQTLYGLRKASAVSSRSNGALFTRIENRLCVHSCRFLFCFWAMFITPTWRENSPLIIIGQIKRLDASSLRTGSFQPCARFFLGR